MLRLKTNKGFTLVEIILVVLVLAAIAAIVIPRITYSANEGKTAACNANVSAINTMIEYAYVKDGVAYPTDDTELTAFLDDTTYFPDGRPECPFGATIAYTEANERAVKHTDTDHGI